MCNQCYATFEPETVRVGEFSGKIGPIPAIETTGPTAPCARCGECSVFALSDAEVPANQVLCVACRALLTLDIKLLESS